MSLPLLPTRVLDLSSDIAAEKVKSHINNGDKGKYTALKQLLGKHS